MEQKKYYRIRKELVWVVGFLLVLSLGLWAGKEFKAIEVLKQEETTIKEQKEIPPVKSELKDVSKCYLCGNADKSLMGYFRKFDDLGIISVNQWYVLDLGIRTQGELEEDYNGTRTSHTGTGERGDFFSSTQIPSRGISMVEVRYGDDSIFDVEKVKKILCQACLDKLCAVMETYGSEGEDSNPRDLCLVDFTTLELYSLQEQYASYYIRDYYVRLDQKDDGMEIEAIFAPERD